MITAAARDTTCPMSEWRRLRALATGMLAVLLGSGLSFLFPASPIPHGEAIEPQNRQKRLIVKKMVDPYYSWLNGEVVYLITPSERAAFKHLTTDDEREQFIEQFWERRNPEPGSPENKFKQEYYRRIVFANERFSSSVPGWKTDRGRVYIQYGPPDEIEWHADGGALPLPDGTYRTVTFPFGRWRYNHIWGIGKNIEVDWVDPTNTGEVHMTIDPGKPEPFSQHEFYTGLVKPGDLQPEPEYLRLPRTYGVTSGQAWREIPAETVSVDPYTGASNPTQPRFPELRAVLDSHLMPPNRVNLLVRTYFVPATDETTLTLVAIQLANGDLKFEEKGGDMHAQVEIYIRIETLTGRTVNEFERRLAVDVSQPNFEQHPEAKSFFQENIPLRPGRYRLQVVLKDEGCGHTGFLASGIIVPRSDDSRLGTSSLILAPSMEPRSSTEWNTFTIGENQLLTNPGQMFSRNQQLGAYLQIYNLGLDPATQKPSLNVQYQILKDGKPIVEEADAPQFAHASVEFTLNKRFPLQSLQPGRYTLQIKVTDNLRRETITLTTSFVVR